MSNYDPPSQPPQGDAPGGDQSPPPPPPPPGGQGGAPPPPPPPADQGGYGGGQPQAYTIGNAFNYGWTKFQANIGPIILAVLAIVGIFALLFLIQSLVVGVGSAGVETTFDPETGAFETTGGGFIGPALFVSGLFGLVAFFVSFAVYVGIVRASLDVTYGRQITVASIFRFDNLAQVLLAAVIIGVAYVVGLFLCVIPGLVVLFFTQFTAHFIVDKQLPALEAIKASVGFVNRNLGTLIGFYIASIVAYLVGVLLCGIGVLVAIPVIIIASAYTYRVLQGETVAA